MSMDLSRIRIGRTEDLRSVYCAERYTHLLVLGKSGAGKSSWILGRWEEDERGRCAKALVDPGFLPRECYAVSKGRAIYCSLDHPVSLNPMQSPYGPDTVSDLIAECVNQVIALTTPNQPFTVKMRSILDDAIKYCLAHNRKNLMNVRDYIATLKGDGETRDGIIHRLNFLVNDERMQPILCGNDSLKWGEFIARGQTFILDCFGMSREKMVFAGNLVSQGIKNYFRYERPRTYHPLALYIDECHNFVNFNFMDILKEGRKFKLSCVLSTQDFASIDERLARVMLNVGTLVCFRVGAREAALIAKEMDCAPQELQFLEKYHLAYMTPKERGFAKAPRPPLAKRMEIKPASTAPRTEPRAQAKGWFPLVPCESV